MDFAQALVIVGAILIIIVGLYALMYSLIVHNKLFKELAQILQWKFKKAKFFGDPEISGNIEGCPVRLIPFTTGKTSFLQVEAKITPDILVDFHITNETTLTRMERRVGIKDVETWDNGFDESMLLYANYPHILIALLNVDIRRLIMDLSRASNYFEITKAEVTVRIKRTRRIKVDPLLKLIRLAVVVSQNLSKDISLEQRFAQNIKSDPLPYVRLNNILALTIYYSDTSSKPRMAAILKEALKDSSLEVQVEAARHLEEEGMNHLLKILESQHESLEPTMMKEILEILR